MFVQGLPGPSAGAVPAAWPQAAPPGAPAVPQARPQPAVAAAPQQPRPLVRAQMPDEPAAPAPRPAIALPTPEECDVKCPPRPAAGEPDWAAVHARVKALGAVCFQVEKLAPGGSRVTCVLPTAQAGRTHRIEARAATDAEAVRVALEQAEQWTGAMK